MNKKNIVAILSVLVIVSLSITAYTGYQIYSQPEKRDEEITGLNQTKKKEVEPKTSSFTFAGVGDNLIHDAIYLEYLNGNTNFDFNQDYALMKQYIEPVDLAYINQETVCAGEEFGLSNYPTFNGPTQILDATFNTGFDWFAASSNHSLDVGAEGLIAELNYIHERYPDVSITGAYRTQEESEKYVVREVNGIKVGLLGYTYGTNGVPLPEDKPWILDLIDEEKIKNDVQEISQISDVQIVSMHWGTEYNTEIEPDQEELAKKMNEWGVEVIIGTHPHVIKPAEIIKGEDQDTLCYYSLGNFLSAQDTNDRMVGGMASFTLNYDFTNKETTFENVEFTPTITYFEPNFANFKTMTIHEYDNNYASNHYVTALGYDMSKEWIQNYVKEIVGEPEGIEVVLE